jgi:hypothetical protein
MNFLLELVIGSIAAIAGYALARRLLDFFGLEKRFQNSIWHYTVSQFGEIILLVIIITVVTLTVFTFRSFK